MHVRHVTCTYEKPQNNNPLEIDGYIMCQKLSISLTQTPNFSVSTFNTKPMGNSIAYRGVTRWNSLAREQKTLLNNNIDSQRAHNINTFLKCVLNVHCTKQMTNACVSLNCAI